MNFLVKIHVNYAVNYMQLSKSLTFVLQMKLIR